MCGSAPYAALFRTTPIALSLFVLTAVRMRAAAEKARMGITPAAMRARCQFPKTKTTPTPKPKVESDLRMSARFSPKSDLMSAT